MNIELIVDEKIENEKVVIYAKNNREEIANIINKISIDESLNKLVGYIDNTAYILNIDDVWLFYTENGKVYAKAENRFYRIKYRIYEIEQILEDKSFIRISSSEIVNIKYIESLDLGKIGTLIFKFKDGSTTYASRRSINKIKKYLGI